MIVAGLLFAGQFRHIWDSVKRHRAFVQISQLTWPWSNGSECCPPRGSLFSDGSQRRHQLNLGTNTHTYMHLAGIDTHACCSSETPDVCGQGWHGSVCVGGESSYPWGKTTEVWSLFFTCSIVWGDCGNHKAPDSQIVLNVFSEVISVNFSEWHNNEIIKMK